MRVSLRPLIILSLALVACAGDDDGDPVATDDPVDEVTYDDVAAVMDAHCTNCHGAEPSNGAPFSLDTYEAASDRIDGIIKRGVDGDPTPMPPSGLSITGDEASTLQAWKDAGTPE